MAPELVVSLWISITDALLDRVGLPDYSARFGEIPTHPAVFASLQLGKR